MSFWTRGKGHAERAQKAAQAAYAEAAATARAQRKEIEEQKMREKKKLGEKQVRMLRRSRRRAGFSQAAPRTDVTQKLG